jgi:hypothetical protein
VLPHEVSAPPPPPERSFTGEDHASRTPERIHVGKEPSFGCGEPTTSSEGAVCSSRCALRPNARARPRSSCTSLPGNDASRAAEGALLRAYAAGTSRRRGHRSAWGAFLHAAKAVHGRACPRPPPRGGPRSCGDPLRSSSCSRERATQADRRPHPARLRPSGARRTRDPIASFVPTAPSSAAPIDPSTRPELDPERAPELRDRARALSPRNYVTRKKAHGAISKAGGVGPLRE